MLIFSAESKVVAVLLRCWEGGWINHQNDNQRRNGEELYLTINSKQFKGKNFFSDKFRRLVLYSFSKSCHA